MSREGGYPEYWSSCISQGLAKPSFSFTKIGLTKDIYAENMSKITLAGRPVTRESRRQIATVVNFDGFQCPFCARMHIRH